MCSVLILACAFFSAISQISCCHLIRALNFSHAIAWPNIRIESTLEECCDLAVSTGYNLYPNGTGFCVIGGYRLMNDTGSYVFYVIDRDRDQCPPEPLTVDQAYQYRDLAVESDPCPQDRSLYPINAASLVEGWKYEEDRVIYSTPTESLAQDVNSYEKNFETMKCHVDMKCEPGNVVSILYEGDADWTDYPLGAEVRATYIEDKSGFYVNEHSSQRVENIQCKSAKPTN